MSQNPALGSTLDDLLRDEGLYEQAHMLAVKRVLAWQIAQLMQEHALTKQAMAERMCTSRAALNRLLDPESDSVTLRTLQRAAHSLGKRLRIELVD